jgi:hypothetical protein
LLYEFILSYKEAVPFIFIGLLALFGGIHWLLDRKIDKSIPYKSPKPITYTQTGLTIAVIIASFFLIETNPALSGLIVTFSSAIITGLANFVEGLYIGANIPESKRQGTLYFNAAFSLLFGFGLLWITGSWLQL